MDRVGTRPSSLNAGYVKKTFGSNKVRLVNYCDYSAMVYLSADPNGLQITEYGGGVQAGVSGGGVKYQVKQARKENCPIQSKMMVPGDKCSLHFDGNDKQAYLTVFASLKDYSAARRMSAEDIFSNEWDCIMENRLVKKQETINILPKHLSAVIRRVSYSQLMQLQVVEAATEQSPLIAE